MKMNKMLGRKIITGLLIGGVLTSTGMAFAGESNDGLNPAGNFRNKLANKRVIVYQEKNQGFAQKGFKVDFKKLKPEAMQEKLELRLAEKVVDGTMTQEEADQIKEEMAAKQALMEVYKALAPEEREGFLSEKVDEGVITQEQADRMLKFEEMREMKEAYKVLEPEEREEFLSEKVAEGVITQEKAEWILKGEQMRAMMEEYKALAPEEREAFLSEKVAEGVMTQDQADRMLEGKKVKHEKRDLAAMKEKMEVRLAEKVAAGTITQERADQFLQRFSK